MRRLHILGIPILKYSGMVLLLSASLFSFAFPSHAATNVSGHITQDTTWNKTGSPYVVTGDIVVRHATNGGPIATLTIEPGVEVRFNPGTLMQIGYSSYYGALHAQGTIADPIIFTSNAATPAAGDWKGIIFSDTSDDATTVLEHCVVEYGGTVYTYGYATNVKADILCYSASPAIKNSVVQKSGGQGIYLYGSSNPVIGGEGIGNTINDNAGYGIYNYDTSQAPTIIGNIFSGNGSYPLRIRAMIKDLVYGNSYSGNGIQGIEIIGEHITADTTWNNEIPLYIVTSDIVVRHATSGGPIATLTIEPGVEVRFNPGTLMQIGYSSYYGALHAQGTIADPIIFTSNAATPAAGDWKGIIFSDTSDDATTVLEHCVVEYGGTVYTYGYATNVKADILCYSASPAIKNSVVQKSGGQGIYLYVSSPNITQNTIDNNAACGIYLIGSSNPLVGGEDNGNIISNSGTYAIYANDSGPHPLISHNSISNYGTYAMRLPARMNVHDNNYSGNGTRGIEVIGEHITADTIWRNEIPLYIVTGDIYVRHATAAGPIATLTIEPGVEVRFNPGTLMQIGYSSCYGALHAQGTIADPIIFTSNAGTPASGDWKGIIFSDTTDDATTVLEHCVVEYGGTIYTYGNATNVKSDILCYSASPAIKNSVIQKSSGQGIYLYGSSNPVIGGEGIGNTINDNAGYGIYNYDTSQAPTIIGNIFSGNGSYPLRIRAMIKDLVYGNSYSGNGIQGIEIIGEHIIADTTWRNEIPLYIVTGDIYVRHTTNGGPIATLTIEPGVEVRLNPGTLIQIGYSSYYGALNAQGTIADPIIFTSNAGTPASGDWKGIIFSDTSDDATTVLEHCVVEYGGTVYTYGYATNVQADILCYLASPTLQYNLIQNSSRSGLVLYGTGCNGAMIRCNNFKDNKEHAVYSSANAQPAISENNFLHNNYGVFNASSGVTVNAVQNWWGDVAGPGLGSADNISGKVDASNWLASLSTCTSTPPTNKPPYAAREPNPADKAVKIDLVDTGANLSWKGGDPNPWDVVVYDLYFGLSAESLVLSQSNLSGTSAIQTGLENGRTYYWRILSRDNSNAETWSPVWSFTTRGEAPDLVVGLITSTPADNIVAGQSVTFTAEIGNQGSGPVVDSFKVDFLLSGVTSLGIKTIDQVISSGTTIFVTSAAWEAKKGQYTILVKADMDNTVPETIETNNEQTLVLADIPDTLPPELKSTVPANNSLKQMVSEILVTVKDKYGLVDDVFMQTQGILVKNSLANTIPGTTAKVGDGQFRFAPDVSPMPDEVYTVAIIAKDDSGNTAEYTVTFSVDSLKPAPPAITGGAIWSGTIQARPFENKSRTTSVTLTGARETQTGVWINNVNVIALGSGDWSVNRSLSQGANTFEIYAQDAAGNKSDSVYVDITLDSIAPQIQSIAPADNSFLNSAPQEVRVVCVEAVSGLDPEHSYKSIKNQDNNEVSGLWALSGTTQLVFTPAAAFPDATYGVTLLLQDYFTNSNAASSAYHFTVDTLAPNPPVINPVATPTTNASQILSGTREEYASLWINDQEVSGHEPGTTWQSGVTLTPGANLFSLRSEDRAGNLSQASSVTIEYNDVAPPPVATLAIDPKGDGRTAKLDWTGYAGAQQGDIALYRVYAEQNTFNDIGGLTAKATVDAPAFTHTLTGLEKKGSYYMAVVAYDLAGKYTSGVTPVFVTLVDQEAPEDVTGLNLQSQETGLIYSWTPSLNSANDLEGYRIFFNDDLSGVTTTQNGFQASGLNPAAAYNFKIKAYDDSGNLSQGKSLAGHTWLANPGNLKAFVGNSRIELSWDPVSPAPYLKHYAVYLSTSAFTDVSGVTPMQTVPNGTNKTNLTNLTNGTVYYLAVTSVNLSEGENKTVTTLSASPQTQKLAHYTMDQIAGNALKDETGRYDGLIYGAPAQVAGYSQSALRFNGQGDWIGLDSLKGAPATGDSLSLSLWFNTQAQKNFDWANILFSANEQNKNNLFRLGTGNSGGIYYSVANDFWEEYGSGFNDGYWHHLVAVQESSGVFRIYLDKIQIASGARQVAWSNAHYFSLGQKWSTDPSNFYTGLLDEVQLFNYALNQTEIQNLCQDRLAPALIETEPLDQSTVKPFNQVKMVLKDFQGDLDNTYIQQNIVVKKDQNPVSGTISNNAGTFIFTPDAAPLGQGNYQVSLSARDILNNTAAYGFGFLIDDQAPAAPVITGGQVLSGLLQPGKQNLSNRADITVTGTRESQTSIWINNALKAALANDPWAVDLVLNQGQNTLEIWAQDQAANKSAGVNLEILVDSVAPVVSGVSPQANALLNQFPNQIRVAYQETGSGVSLSQTTLYVKQPNAMDLAGAWNIDSGLQAALFTPAGGTPTPDGTYRIFARLVDELGNAGAVFESAFTLDTLPPPVVGSLTASGQGEGTSVTLDWTRYQAGEELSFFRVYREATEFSSATDLTTLTPVAQVSANTLTYKVTGLVSGQTYWFCVVAADKAGNAISTGAYVVSAAPQDKQAPAEVVNLRVTQAQETGLTIGWDAPQNQPDLNGYKIYFNKDPNPITQSMGQTGYAKSGLEPGSAYPVRVSTFDQNLNESAGLMINACTLLNNPVNLLAKAQSGRVDLSWANVNPGENVKHYAVYVKQQSQPLTSVEGLTPVLTSTNTFAKVQGLGNGLTYQLAVTTVNISGYENKQVNSVSAVPNTRLLAHYTLNAVSGTNLPDETGSHAGTLNGNPGVVSGYLDQALSLDGHSDWISLNSLSGDLVTGDNLSLSLWFKTNAAKAADSANILFAANNQANKNDILRLGTGKNGGIYYAVGASAGVFSSGHNDNFWHHLVLTQGGQGNFKLYVDKTLIASGTRAPTAWEETALISLGQEWDASPSDFFSGQIDEVRIYNYVLSESEISELHPDKTAPVLVSSDPADLSSVLPRNQISLVLKDYHGPIDIPAVLDSIQVKDQANQNIPGAATNQGDQFFFSVASNLIDGHYQVSLTARDLAGNSVDYAFGFQVDSAAPAAPVITGGQVLSGVIAAGKQNKSNTLKVTLTGERDADTALRINDEQKISLGGGPWSCEITLAQGANLLALRSVDQAGNQSPQIQVELQVDSLAPVISATNPAEGAFLKTPPSSLVITCQDSNGLNLANSTRLVKNQEFQDIPGTWALQDNDKLVFAPATGLTDNIYTVTLQLEDTFANRNNLSQVHFTLDSVAPAPPVVQPVTSPTPKAFQLLKGTREEYSSLWINGQEVLGHAAGASWQSGVTLTPGANLFSLRSEDRAGNVSEAAQVEILYQDEPPKQVSTLTVNAEGDGVSARLNWQGYDESEHGDIASYRIYAETNTYSTISALTPKAQVNAGTFTHTLNGLSRNTLYYFSVVAVDKAGQFLTAVTPVSATTLDNIAPGNPQNLKVESFLDRLRFTWSAPSESDLQGFKAYFNNGPAETLTKDQLSLEKSGLSPANVYAFKIAALDQGNNESPGLALNAYTWLANPDNLQAEPQSSYLNLTWNGVSQTEYLKHYRVYASRADFNSVAGMTPALTASFANAKVAGLTNNVTYYLAVTAVNKSDGENKQVSTISAVPIPDTQGPLISDLMADDQPLLNGLVLTKSVTFKARAADPGNVSRVDFYLNNKLIATDSSANPYYEAAFDPAGVNDGPGILTIKAYDSQGNMSSVDVSLSIALAAPAAPVIGAPSDNTLTNQNTIRVSGTAPKGTEIVFYNNDLVTGQPVPVDNQGRFSAELLLFEGQNPLQAAAQNRAGLGPKSNTVRVLVETDLPSMPLNMSGQTRENGWIRLSWRSPELSLDIQGYNLYRSDRLFASPGEAVKVNQAGLIKSEAYEDLPGADGIYYYAVASVSQANNESTLSDVVLAKSDRTRPRALSIVYTPSANYDPLNMRFGQGPVQVQVTVSEALQAIPFLSLTPQGGTPLTIDLIPESETTYNGLVHISANLPGGTAWAVFSARDLASNRGTEIDEGKNILIDTRGPAVKALNLVPGSPIRNEQAAPVSVTVTLDLDEKIPDAKSPTLAYLLSGPGRNAMAIPYLNAITPNQNAAQTWQAQFMLPPDAGFLPENLHFQITSVDDLNNESGRIDCPNLFQVYQGDLPPLDTPQNLAAAALAGGKVKLTWDKVTEAKGYRLYGKTSPPGPPPACWEGTGAGDFFLVKELGPVFEYMDEPGDGTFIYVITSLRESNGQAAESGPSPAVSVNADNVAPLPPSNLVLELVSQGVKIAFTPSPDPDVTYCLYRAGQEITSATLSGVTALACQFKETLVVDPKPSLGEHYYAVTAKDKVGNESLPSNSPYLNATLLPVNAMQVVQNQLDFPILTWAHAGGDISGFGIYLASGVTLAQTSASVKTYTDLGYSGDLRKYIVKARDNLGQESLGREITLPKVAFKPLPGFTLKRGIMNRLAYEVRNTAVESISNLKLIVNLNAKDHFSETFDLGANQTQVVYVTLGGYAELPAVAEYTATLEHKPDANASSRIVRTGQFDVADGMLILQIMNETLVKAAAGKIGFSLENTGDEEIEVTLAQNNAASPDIRINLQDQDGNVSASQKFLQAVGEGVVNLSNKNSVARIPAHAVFKSQLMEMPVPGAAPDNLIIKLNLANVYYHQGQENQVLLPIDLSVEQAVSLIETSYYGELLDISPGKALAGEKITILGRAVERSTQKPLPNAELKVKITVSGFERIAKVTTDEQGAFSYLFEPLANESGVYSVAVVHPDLTDKPEHGRFTIERLGVTPTTWNIQSAFNYPRSYDVKVSAAPGTTVYNLRLEAAAALPAGLHLAFSAPVPVLGPGLSALCTFNLWADAAAEKSYALQFKLLGARQEGGADTLWQTIQVNASFSIAKPALSFEPNYLETGLAFEETVSEEIKLGNKGLAEMSGVTLCLLTEQGLPAPAWVYLASSSDLGSIGVGETKTVGIGFSPRSGEVLEGVHPFKLRVASSNAPLTDINIFAAVTQSGQGNVIFKIDDIYTGTLNNQGEVVQGLQNARIYLQNEAVPSITADLHTDQAGEAYFQDLPAGFYKCRITADKHQEKIARVWIKPGITKNETIFLEYNLVTVEWEVKETTIKDKYEIILHLTFETDVPAAVVVIEPGVTNMPDMKTGQVFNGEFTITNYGLIKAEDMTMSMPPETENFRFELLAGVPEVLEAKQKISVPYRITCLKTPNTEEGGSGGGCGWHTFFGKLVTGYKCANGEWQAIQSRKFWVWYEKCGTAPPPPPVISDGTGVSIGGGGSSSGDSGGPGYETIKGAECLPKVPLMKRFLRLLKAGWKGFKDGSRKVLKAVGCEVNLVTREYYDNPVDLTVKVPGGMIEVQRLYYENKWHWDHIKPPLEFTYSPIEPDRIAYLIAGGMSYGCNGSCSGTFSLPEEPEYIIIRNQEEIRETDKYGNWWLYDKDGYYQSYGDRHGLIGRMIYEGKQITGVADRNGRQVLWHEYEGDNLVAVQDLAGRRVEYAYTNNLLTKVKDALKQETVYEYDANGRIMKTMDTAGRSTLVTYHANGSVASVVDKNGVGHFFEWSHDSSKSLSYAKVRSTSGAIEEHWYDDKSDEVRYDLNGRTIQTITKFSAATSLPADLSLLQPGGVGRNWAVKDEKGHVTRYYFDEKENLTKVVYADNTEAEIEYDLTINKPRKIINQKGVYSAYEYDEKANLIKSVDAAGTGVEKTTLYTYDGQGRMLSAAIQADQNTPEAAVRFTYDSNGNLQTLTDPEEHVTHFLEYDVEGNLKKLRDAGNYEWNYGYDDLGRLISQTDPDLNTTSFEYDGANNQTAVINALAKRFSFEYDDHNNLVRAVDPYQKTIITEYNTDNLPVEVTDQEGKSAQNEYDNEGRLRKSIDGAGNQIQYFYDESMENPALSNLPVRIEYPTYTRKLYYNELLQLIKTQDIYFDQIDQIHETGYVYDLLGNLVESQDEEGHATTYAYDELNRLIKVTDPSNGSVERAYDNRGNLLSVKDQKGAVTAYEYDKNNRLAKLIRPLGQASTYEYDALGNRTAVNDPKGQRIEYEYNKLNRLVKTKYFSAADHVNPVKVVSFTYDKLGNLKTYDDGVTSGTYTYDDLNRKLSETVDYGPFSKSHSYTYYANGLKKSFIGPDNIEYAYTYDSNNRLSLIDVPNQGAVTYQAFQWNSPVKVLYPGGANTEYQYDPLMRIKKILEYDPAQNPVMTREYEYSKSSNVLAKKTEHGDYGYTYDALYRLTNETHPSNGTNETISYSYDAIGNRLSKSGIPGTWAYNANAELMSFGSTSFQYDPNGNLTNGTNPTNETNYIYDVADQLVQVTDGAWGVVADYAYDPFGRRLWKQVDGIRTYFVYSDEGLIAEADPNGSLTKTYGYRPNSQWTTDPLFQKIGDVYYWYKNDSQGTPQKMVDTSGHVVWEARYDAFGNCEIITQEIENNLRLAGQYFDQETGLYYNYHRYYDPITGRYLQTDPYREGLNLYAYCRNNPNSFIDPLGLCAFKKIWGPIKEILWILQFGPLREFGKELMYAYGPDWMINFYENLVSGYYLGTGFGEEAAQYYAEKYNETGNPLFYLGGLGASLWTPDTYLDTALTLASGYGAGEGLVAKGRANTPRNAISPGDLTGKTRNQIRDMARNKGLQPSGDPAHPDYPRKWKDPATNKEKLRLDRGHVDPTTGRPYNDPKAKVDHVHGYDDKGNKIRDPFDNNPHFPTTGE